MRILISTWSLQVGGGEVLAMNLAAELAKRGHDVFLFNQRAELIDHDVVQRLLPPSVKVLSMADKPRRSFWAYKINALQQRLGRSGNFYLRQQQAYFADCLQRYNIEVVNSHATFSDEICAPVLARTGLPLVITEHGDYSQFLLDGRRDFAHNLRVARQILTVSDYCRHQLQAAFPDLPPMRTVYNGVVTNQDLQPGPMREAMGIPADAFVLGMVARGVEKKGWKYAVEAFRQLRATAQGRPLRLVLVGGSAYLQQLKAECTADADILFTGQVPNPDFYVAGFDVGLLPTYFAAEALPLAVIEYMVSGKPSIASRVGGVPELLNPAAGPTGQMILLDEQTMTPRVDMLVEAMRRYYEDADLYAQHAANARAARVNFTMPACAAQYEQAFEASMAVV
jgi:glycosyltransferase involved in cell wall biosynthesis